MKEKERERESSFAGFLPKYPQQSSLGQLKPGARNSSLVCHVGGRAQASVLACCQGAVRNQSVEAQIAWCLPVTWEVYIEFSAPGFGLYQLQLLQALKRHQTSS